jgi:hypothetical protein
MLTAALLTTAQLWNQLVPISQRMDNENVINIQTFINYLLLFGHKEEILSFAENWMELKDR